MANLRCPFCDSPRQWNRPSARKSPPWYAPNDALKQYQKDLAEELKRTHPNNCDCPDCSNYIYVCQNCALIWQQEPHQPPKILSSIEDAKNRLEENRLKKIKENKENEKANQDAYAQQWWEHHQNH